MKELIAIFIGGGLGSVCRFGVGRLVINQFPGHLPLGTFLANVLSCLVLGGAVYLISKEQIQGMWIPFIVFGFCGGFSTFSTFSFETMMLINEQRYAWAALNIIVSVVVCVAILFFISKYFQ